MGTSTQLAALFIHTPQLATTKKLMNFKKTTSNFALVFAATLIFLGPSAHADVSALKELLKKSKAEAPAATASTALTQKHIDQLLPAVPAFQDVIKEIEAPEPSKAQEKEMMFATMEGRPFSAVGTLFEHSAHMTSLDTQAKTLGYTGYANYAERADAVMKVLTAEQWILAARNITRDGEPKPEPISNLWLYIDDQSKDAAERKKLSGQLDEMLAKLGSTPADAEQVYNNIDAIRAVFQPTK